MRISRIHTAVVLAVALGALATVGCPDDDNPQFGLLSVSAQGMSEGVVGISYEVVCEDGTTASAYVPLEEEGLPPFIDEDLAGASFADFLTTLPAGDCTVTATAMIDPDTPAPGCEPVSEDVTIVAGETTEVVMVIVCDPSETGALDAVVVVTDGVHIIDITYDDSKFITQCEEVTITIDAEGGGGPLTYDYVVTTEPPGASYTLMPSGNSMTFWSETPGTYEITVTITDGSGGSATMVIPIHVSEDPDIEHCDDTCCQLADGHVFFGNAEACEDAAGIAVADQICEEALCCKTAAGPMFVAAADCPQGGVLDDTACEPEELCCQLEDGTVFWTPSLLGCTDPGGHPVHSSVCREEVCCDLAPPAIVAAVDCAPGQVLPADKCDLPPICCRLPDGNTYVLTPGDCADQLGAEVSADECSPEVCCLVGDDYQTLPESTCEGTAGAPADGALCRAVCCEFEPPAIPAVIEAGDCQQQGGTPGPLDLCGNVATHVWDADYTLDPTVDCETAPYLVVPSSGANQLAVYDTTTLTPLPTTPFDTCANPSRILMDANTDVYATCRSDGRVNKHTRDGVLLWSIQLPGCNGARGIAMSGSGRLFAACSDDTNQNVYELAAATGAIINSVDTGYMVYGLAVDADGVYVASLFENRVSKIQLGGAMDMTIAWSVPQSAYGITVDQSGVVWIGGSPLRGLSTATGAVVDSVPIIVTVPGGGTSTAYTYGVMVGLDGNVYGATMLGVIYRYEPGTGTLTDWLLDAGGTGNRGITLDADGDIYSINLSSNSLTHSTPAGVPTGFGDDAGTVFLVNPYGYSGDMTGLTTTCLAGTTDIWFSDEVDSGVPTTVWQTISWSATTPPGSSVSIYYSTDGGTIWTAATNGQLLNVTAQTFAVKAILQSTIPGNEPTVYDITVTYQ